MHIPTSDEMRKGLHTEKVKFPKEKGKRPSTYRPKPIRIKKPKRK